VRPSGFSNSEVLTQTLKLWIFEASAKAHNEYPTLFRNAELPSAKAERSHQTVRGEIAGAGCHAGTSSPQTIAALGAEVRTDRGCESDGRAEGRTSFLSPVRFPRLPAVD
jgi:hypothetical protein